MKLRLLHFGALLCLSAALPAAFAQQPAESARDLVKDVAYNELQDRKVESFWQYRIEKRVGNQTTVERRIETRSGPVDRVVARQGKPLDLQEQAQETKRLKDLLRHPGEQARVKQAEEDDRQHVQRLILSMPDAFLFTYDGMDEGKIRLRFEPNPAFNPPTFEARIYHVLAGLVWIDPGQKRLVRIDGRVVAPLEFGFGLLGRVDAGGTFEIRRERVSGTHWRTVLLDVHISGRMILFKSIKKDQHELRSDFQPLPQNLAMFQAIRMLDGREDAPVIP